MTNYDAHVSREGKWWMVRVPAIDDLTQARRLSEASRMAAELVALATDAEVDSIEIDLHYGTVGTVERLESKLEQLYGERETAARAESNAAAQSRELARELVDADVPLRDVGTILGVSHQRVHQLVSS